MATSQTSTQSCLFTLDENNPLRIIRMELEFVDFTLKVTTQNGETYLITNPDSIQELLDKAHEFNLVHFDGSNNRPIDSIENNHDDVEGRVTAEIKLDPLNSINTFHIPL